MKIRRISRPDIFVDVRFEDLGRIRPGVRPDGKTLFEAYTSRITLDGVVYESVFDASLINKADLVELRYLSDARFFREHDLEIEEVNARMGWIC